VDHKRNFVELTLRKSTSSSKKSASLALTDFEVGQKVTASVKKVEDYGLFLKIDGSELSGLCHKSEVRATQFSQMYTVLIPDLE
jgi:rRNA biogenesis protein RRP5